MRLVLFFSRKRKRKIVKNLVTIQLKIENANTRGSLGEFELEGFVNLARRQGVT